LGNAITLFTVSSVRLKRDGCKGDVEIKLYLCPKANVSEDAYPDKN
jgi:hypothetical protein